MFHTQTLGNQLPELHRLKTLSHRFHIQHSLRRMKKLQPCSVAQVQGATKRESAGARKGERQMMSHRPVKQLDKYWLRVPRKRSVRSCLQKLASLLPPSPYCSAALQRESGSFISRSGSCRFNDSAQHFFSGRSCLRWQIRPGRIEVSFKLSQRFPNLF